MGFRGSCTCQLLYRLVAIPRNHVMHSSKFRLKETLRRPPRLELKAQKLYIGGTTCVTRQVVAWLMFIRLPALKLRKRFPRQAAQFGRGHSTPLFYTEPPILPRNSQRFFLSFFCLAWQNSSWVRDNVFSLFFFVSMFCLHGDFLASLLSPEACVDGWWSPVFAIWVYRMTFKNVYTRTILFIGFVKWFMYWDGVGVVVFNGKINELNGK